MRQYDPQLYMHFQKPMPSAQGMAVWDERAYILYDGGYCGIYDLQKKDEKPIAFFPLGSCNPGLPDKNHRNHANSCMFGTLHYGDNPIPLLYVTIGSGIGMDEDGFYYRCAVENIVRTIGEDGSESYQAQTLQTICYRPGAAEGSRFLKPAWGCPAFLTDDAAGVLYIFSAKYRTTRGYTPPNTPNTYIVTQFLLPDVSQGGLIHLGPKDILDQFSVESDVQFTQGGTVWNNKLFYTFGCPERNYPIHIMAFDLQTKALDLHLEELDTAFAQEEIECCAVYGTNLLCNTCNGSIFSISLERRPDQDLCLS